MVRECRIHGQFDHSRRKGGGWRCKKCQSLAVTKRRRRVKETLIQEHGGKCNRCGYDKCIGALTFHHLCPNEKEFGLGLRGLTRSLEKMREEAAKCELLCANCHHEEHYTNE